MSPLIATLMLIQSLPAFANTCHEFTKPVAAREQSIAHTLQGLGPGQDVWVIGASGKWGIPFQTDSGEMLSPSVLGRLRSEWITAIAGTPWTDRGNFEGLWRKPQVSPSVVGLVIMPSSGSSTLAEHLSLTITTKNPIFQPPLLSRLTSIFTKPLPSLDFLESDTTCSIVMRLTQLLDGEVKPSRFRDFSVEEFREILSKAVLQAGLSESGYYYLIREYSEAVGSFDLLSGMEVAIVIPGRESDVGTNLGLYRKISAVIASIER